MVVVHLTTQQECLDAFMNSNNQLVVFDFTAKWCGPCRMIAPKVEALSVEYPQVAFYKVDVDELPEITQRHEVRAMPTFQFFINEQMVSEFSGASVQNLVDHINQGLQKLEQNGLTNNEGTINENSNNKMMPPSFETL